MIQQLAALALPISLLLLALEHFGVPIKGWITGIALIIAAVVALFGIA